MENELVKIQGCMLMLLLEDDWILFDEEELYVSKQVNSYMYTM